MPPLGPIKRRDLIRYLRWLGFEGPYSGGKHQYMVKDMFRLRIPNPHSGDIGRELLVKVLEQGGINRAIWEQL